MPPKKFRHIIDQAKPRRRKRAVAKFDKEKSEQFELFDEETGQVEILTGSDITNRKIMDTGSPLIESAENPKHKAVGKRLDAANDIAVDRETVKQVNKLATIRKGKTPIEGSEARKGRRALAKRIAENAKLFGSKGKIISKFIKLTDKIFQAGSN
jgi:hypothetical protein